MFVNAQRKKREADCVAGTGPLTFLWTDRAETWWNHSRIISVNIWCLSLSYWLAIFGQHKPGLCAQYILIHLKCNQKTNRSHYCDWQLFLCLFVCFTEHSRTKWSTVNNMNRAACRYRCFSLFHWGDQEILIWESRRNTNVSVRMAHVVSARQTAWRKQEADTEQNVRSEAILCLILCSRVMWLVMTLVDHLSLLSLFECDLTPADILIRWTLTLLTPWLQSSVWSLQWATRLFVPLRNLMAGRSQSPICQGS